MRWGLVTVRIAMTLVSLFIAAVIVLSVLPLASGQLQVDMPETGGQDMAFQDGVVTMTVPVDVYNGGYFDITDLRLRMQVSDAQGTIMDYSTDPAVIQAGRNNRLDLTLQMDLNDLSPEDLRDMVFNQTVLGLDIAVEGTYSLGLISVMAHAQQSMDWEPLISDIVVDTNAAAYSLEGGDLVITVPYSFRASSMVQGDSVEISSTLSNSTTALASSQEVITLQEYNQGSLRYVVPQEYALWLMTHSEDLTIDAEIDYGGATADLQYPYHWEAPL